MKLKYNARNQKEGICGIFQETVHSFLGKEANGKVHIPNYTRNGRDMRIKIANDTATDDTQYFCL